jgi:hypothetical protein
MKQTVQNNFYLDAITVMPLAVYLQEVIESVQFLCNNSVLLTHSDLQLRIPNAVTW